MNWQKVVPPDREKLIALEVFCDSLATSPESEWFPWARNIAGRLSTETSTLRNHRPMFERVVFPALLAGYRPAACAARFTPRWLAGLWTVHRLQSVWQKANCRNEENGKIGLPLVKISILTHDPADQPIRNRL